MHLSPVLLATALDLCTHRLGATRAEVERLSIGDLSLFAQLYGDDGADDSAATDDTAVDGDSSAS